MFAVWQRHYAGKAWEVASEYPTKPWGSAQIRYVAWSLEVINRVSRVRDDLWLVESYDMLQAVHCFWEETALLGLRRGICWSEKREDVIFIFDVSPERLREDLFVSKVCEDVLPLDVRQDDIHILLKCP